MTAPPSRYYRFGTCLVDAKRRRLWQNRQLVPLTAKTFDLLLFLVRRANHVIDKPEFFAALWPDTAVLDANLVRQVSLLRKALGQRADSHDYIVTIPGRGYEFVADVEELQTPPAGWVTDDVPPPPEARVIGVRRRRTWTYGVAAGVAAIALAVAASTWRAHSTGAPASAVERVLRQVTFESGSPREPSWAPDGRHIVFTSDTSGNADLWVQSLGEPRPTQLTTNPAADTAPDWSPDGRWIAFRSEREGGGIFRVSADGSREERVSAFGFHPQWSPSGTLILFSGPTVRTGPRKFYVVTPTGDALREVAVDVVKRFTTSGTTPFGWLNSVAAAWHPDGSRVSFWGRGPTGQFELVTSDLSGHETIVSVIPPDAQEKLQGEVLFRRFAWSPDQRHLYFEGQTQNTTNIWRVSIDASTFAWRGVPERLTTSAGEEADLAVAPHGTSLVVSIGTPRTRLWAMDFDGRTGRVIGPGDAITSGTAGEIDADASRDGTKIAYRATRAGRNEVWELDRTNGQERLLLASVHSRPSLPRWSSDGRYVAYTRGDDAHESNVVSVLSAEQGSERLLTLPPGADMTPTDWYADGTTLLGYCHSEPQQPMSVCSIRSGADGAAESRLRTIASDPGKNLWVPRLSPNQRWIAFLAADVSDAPTSQIFVTSAEGGPWLAITDGQSFEDKPRWSPDGRTIYFISSREGALNLWGRRVDPTTGRPIGDSFRVTSFSGRDRILPSSISRIEFGVTGDQLFLPITEQSANLWILEHADR